MPQSPKDIEKARQEIFVRILDALLKEEDNRYCADCESKGPRWASWNHGVFLCIRCAGIHRNIGVHVTRVKSVNLDSWTEEQLSVICQVGNRIAKLAYEASLPRDFRRPQSDYQLEQFIREKYERRCYASPNYRPPTARPLANIDLPSSVAVVLSASTGKQHRSGKLPGSLSTSDASKQPASIGSVQRTEFESAFGNMSSGPATTSALPKISDPETNSRIIPEQSAVNDDLFDFAAGPPIPPKSKQQSQGHKRSLSDDLMGLDMSGTAAVTANQHHSTTRTDHNDILSLYNQIPMMGIGGFGTHGGPSLVGGSGTGGGMLAATAHPYQHPQSFHIPNSASFSTFPLHNAAVPVPAFSSGNGNLVEKYPGDGRTKTTTLPSSDPFDDFVRMPISPVKVATTTFDPFAGLEDQPPPPSQVFK